MNNRQKNAIYSVVLITVVLLVYFYRNNVQPKEEVQPHDNLIHLKGVTMGVVNYNIKYVQAGAANYQPEVDSLLQAFNQSLSHYIPDSEISRFNKASDSLRLESRFFYPVLAACKTVFEETKGAFDPTVSPLINAWGFGPDKSPIPKDSVSIDSLRQLVGFQQISFTKEVVRKSSPFVSLNFSAVAKGYAVDIVAEFLEAKGIQSYMVEIGREVRCKGVNAKGETWRIGIVNPNYKTQPNQMLNATVALENRSLATSGNYENYYVKDGKRFAHTINPTTGYPVEHNLLSASVFAPDCMTADAYATALMVMGTAQARAFLEEHTTLDAMLIYEEEGEIKTFVTARLQPFVEQVL